MGILYFDNFVSLISKISIKQKTTIQVVQEAPQSPYMKRAPKSIPPCLGLFKQTMKNDKKNIMNQNLQGTATIPAQTVQQTAPVCHQRI